MSLGNHSYTVVWSQDAITTVKAMFERASQLNLTGDLARILRSLTSRLRLDPQNVGEISWVRGAIEHYHAADGFVAIQFAVDTKRKLVLVKSCTALSGRGFT